METLRSGVPRLLYGDGRHDKYDIAKLLGLYRMLSSLHGLGAAELSTNREGLETWAILIDLAGSDAVLTGAAAIADGLHSQKFIQKESPDALQFTWLSLRRGTLISINRDYSVIFVLTNCSLLSPFPRAL